MVRPLDERKARAQDRALLSASSVGDIVKGFSIVRGSRTYVFSDAPRAIVDPDGNRVGIDARVRVFEAGAELRVDPHRRCINPPTAIFVAGVKMTDPREAYFQWLEDSIKKTPNAAGWNTDGTVTTVFSDLSDSDIASTGGVYAGQREGTGVLTPATAAATIFLGQDTLGCYECFFKFDTSPIDDADVVSAAVLSLWTNGDGSATDFTAEVRAYDYGAAVTAADWQAGSTLGTLTLLATFATTGISAVAYNDFVSEAGFPAYIVKTGFTPVIVVSSRHRIGNAPSGSEYWGVRSADLGGTVNDPKLTVTHAAGGAAAGSLRVPGIASIPSIASIGVAA